MSTHRMATYGIGTALAAVLALMMVPSGASITEAGPTMYGMAEVTIKSANGDVLSSNTIHNALTNDGEVAILNAMFMGGEMDSPVVICMSDNDSGDDTARELEDKTFSYSDGFAPFVDIVPEPVELFRTIFVTVPITIDVPSTAGTMSVTNGSTTTIDNTEYVTAERTVLPAGSVVIINGNVVTLEFASFISAGRTVLSVPTTIGFPGVQNVTWTNSFVTDELEYNASEIFFYDVELPHSPPLPLGADQPLIPITITNATDTVARVDFNRNAQNVTVDFNNNGMIDEGDWDVVFVQPGGDSFPCLVSPTQDNVTLVTENFVINGTLVSTGDPPNLDNIVNVIPGPTALIPRILLPDGTVLPNSTVLPDDTVLPPGSVLPAGTVLPANTVLPAGTVLPANTVLPAGTVLPPGTVLPASTVLPADTILLPGTVLPAITLLNGTVLPAGTVLPNDIVLPVDTTLPADTVSPNGIVLPADTTFPAGIVLLDDTTLPDDITLPASTPLPAGIVLPDGTVLPTGIALPDGTTLTNSITVTTQFVVNSSVPVNTTISVISGIAATVTANETQSTAMISANFSASNSVVFSPAVGDLVTVPRNFAPDAQLNTMLICTLDPDTNSTAFADCDTAAGGGGLLFSIINLGGSRIGADDSVEATYTFDITSPGA